MYQLLHRRVDANRAFPEQIAIGHALLIISHYLLEDKLVVYGPDVSWRLEWSAIVFGKHVVLIYQAVEALSPIVLCQAIEHFVHFSTRAVDTLDFVCNHDLVDEVLDGELLNGFGRQVPHEP